jgi:hypothetical protein
MEPMTTIGPEQRELSEQRQNAIAGVALAKTFAFLFLSIPAMMLTLAVQMLLPELLLIDIPIYVVFTFLGVLECVVFWIVLRIRVGESAEPFNERNLIWLSNAIALLTALGLGGSLKAVVFRWVINGIVVLAVVVFFVTKSILSKEIRLDVLSGLLLPLAQYLL